MMRLLDFVFDSSAILLVGLTLMWVLRKRSAALRHWVLAASLVCAAAAPLAERLVPSWEPPFQLAVTEIPLAWAGERPAPIQIPAAAPAPAPNRPAAEPLVAPGPIIDTLLTIWAAGVVLMCAVLAAGLIRLAIVTKQARPVSDGPWAGPVKTLSHAYDVRRAIDVRETDRPNLLLVWGWWRPVLLLPVSAREWSEERILSVLRHELAHLRRGDWLTQMVAESVRAVLWFNPLVWAACARLHVECERACDDAVLESGVGGAQYATHLLDIARDLRHGGWWTPAPAIVRTSTLERRVKAMLDRTVDRRPASRRARRMALAVLLALSVGVASVAATRQFASLTGTIVDPSNALLPGVTLTLTNTETNAKYEIRTDRTGRYEFVGLPPGTYRLESKLPGFSVFRGTVTVAGKNVNQDVMLPVGMLEETVTIVGGPPERVSPEEQEAREAKKLADRQKLDEIKRKRAAATCPGGATTGPAIGGNIRPPVKYRDVRAIYPERFQGVEGVVILSATIDTDGKVGGIEVVSTSHQEFADSMIEAVRQWEFDATLLNCAAIEVPMKITGNFSWRQ